MLGLYWATVYAALPTLNQPRNTRASIEGSASAVLTSGFVVKKPPEHQSRRPYSLQLRVEADWHYVLHFTVTKLFNLYPAKLNNLNFQPLEVVSRYRDPQLQVAENYWYLFIWHQTLANVDV